MSWLLSAFAPFEKYIQTVLDTLRYRWLIIKFIIEQYLIKYLVTHFRRAYKNPLGFFGQWVMVSPRCGHVTPERRFFPFIVTSNNFLLISLTVLTSDDTAFTGEVGYLALPWQDLTPGQDGQIFINSALTQQRDKESDNWMFIIVPLVCTCALMPLVCAPVIESLFMPVMTVS